VLKTGGHKSRDREQNRQDFVGGGARAEGQPHRQADQGVAHHAQNHGLQRVIVELARRQGQRRLAQRPPGERVLASEEHEQGGEDRPHKVAGIDDDPVAQQGARTDLAVGPGHHNEHIAGEQLRPGNDHQDQPQAERQAGQESGHAVGQRPRRAGNHRGGKDAAQRDECPGQDAQHEQLTLAQRSLGHAYAFRPPRHLHRQQGVNPQLLGHTPPPTLSLKKAAPIV